jgi:AraC family transcriptional regulator
MVLEKAVFAAAETHGRALRDANQLIGHSPDAGWQSMYAATFREAPLDVLEAPSGHPSLIYHLARPTRVTRCIDDAKPESALIGPGRFCITPGDAFARWRHAGNPEILQIYVRRSVYEHAVEEMYGCAGTTVRVLPRFAALDPLLEQLAIAVVHALNDGAGEDRLYIESIAQLIAVHLARTHSSRTRPPPVVPEPMSRGRIRKLRDYIEQHLAEDLSLDTLAREAGLSPLYFARAFRLTVGESPHRYVVGRRVEHAKRLLRAGDAPIADIALTAGFSSQSHLSNWFRRIVGVSPGAYRHHA